MSRLPEKITADDIDRIINACLANTRSVKKADARTEMIAQIVTALGVDQVAAFDILAPSRFEPVSEQKPADAVGIAQAILSLPLLDMAQFLISVTGCTHDDAIRQARLLADADPNLHIG